LGPDVAVIGQPIRYEIVVRNSGLMPVFNLRVDDEIPNGVRVIASDPPSETSGNRLSWTIGSLEPYAERRIRVDVQPPGEGELRTNAVVTFSGSTSIQTRIVQPRLALAVQGPEQSNSGDPIPFQILATNRGPAALTAVVLRCQLSEGLQHPQGSIVEADLGGLAPGESRSVTLTATAARGGPQSCELSAVIGNGALDATARAVVHVLEPSLILRRQGPTRCFLKSEIGFELEATNSGSSMASAVVLTETLPAGFEFVMASDGAAYDPSARTITWQWSAMPPAAKRTVTYRVKAAAVGEQFDRAVLRSDRGTQGRAEGAFLIEGVPAMSLEVVDIDDPVEAGGELTYEVRVVNQGSCACSNIQITATAPDALQMRDGSGPTAARVQGAQITFEPLPRLATKADAVYRIKVRGLHPGDHRFRVQMTSDQLQQPVVKEESSRVY
jgi:uncharacterized repeat protein (TIGR01451 family)